MQSKLSKVKAHMQAGEWQEALRMAVKFPDLGAQKSDIKRGHEAYSNARFYQQLGYDIDALKSAGRAALIARYGE